MSRDIEVESSRTDLGVISYEPCHDPWAFDLPYEPSWAIDTGNAQAPTVIEPTALCSPEAGGHPAEHLVVAVGQTTAHVEVLWGALVRLTLSQASTDPMILVIDASGRIRAAVDLLRGRNESWSTGYDLSGDLPADMEPGERVILRVRDSAASVDLGLRRVLRHRRCPSAAH